MRFQRLGVAVVVLALALLRAAAAEATTWSSPTDVTTHGGGYALVACPSQTQCTAVNGGYRYTFDPADLHAVAAEPIPSEPGFASFVCPSTAECVLLATNGDVDTLDPQTADPVTTAHLAVQVVRLACATAQLCVAIGRDTNGGPGTVISFDPRHPATSTAGAPMDLDFPAEVLTCPSATECVLAGAGQVAAVDPRQPTAPPITEQRYSNGDFAANDIACPAADRCTLVNQSGLEYSFDPTAATARFDAVRVGPNLPLTAVGCDAISHCVTASYGAPTTELWEGTPGAGSPWSATDGDDASGPVHAITCPGTGRCVAIEANGRVLSTPPPTSTKPLPTSVGAPRPAGYLTPPGPIGIGSVGFDAAIPDGIEVDLRCAGRPGVRCTYVVTVAAGRRAPAGRRIVTLGRGVHRVRVPVTAAVRRLVRRDRSLLARITVAQRLAGGPVVIAVRTVTLLAPAPGR